jgi:ketosteroid isomerase-like protein
MRSMPKSLLLLFALAGSALAQPADEAAIRAARNRSNRAIAAHDLDGVASVWLPEFHSVSSTNAQANGRDAARASFARYFETRPDVVYLREPNTIAVNSAWGQAGESGRWSGSWTQADGVTRVGGIYFAKWKRADGRWMLLAETFVQTSCSGTTYCQLPP